MTDKATQRLSKYLVDQIDKKAEIVIAGVSVDQYQRTVAEIRTLKEVFSELEAIKLDIQNENR